MYQYQKEPKFIIFVANTKLYTSPTLSMVVISMVPWVTQINCRAILDIQALENGLKQWNSSHFSYILCVLKIIALLKLIFKTPIFEND